MTQPSLLEPRLRALLHAECAAEAAAHTGTEAADLRQGVWLRWLERLRAAGPPAAPAEWLRAAVQAEARAACGCARHEAPAAPPTGPRVPPQRQVAAADGTRDTASDTEAPLLAAERRREVAEAVALLPGRCPAVLRALLSRKEFTYPQIAHELGISQGAVGPLRSRCLECLRRMLAAKVPRPGLRGRVREATGVTRADSTGAAPSPTRARAHTTWGGMRTWA
ncbi:sigma-70 family RNA polymerase sigma factor [Streptomyces albus subsp. chlorinus]|uniref:sigma-70 family RNA polymerase sigma factor n=1 Tax=Streptomyces albus TaxID=1888 RepID=UPI003D0F3910